MLARKRKPDKTGRSLEDAVARIQQMMDPGSKVTQNEWIEDRFGVKRECDVVVRGRFAGHDVLCIMECKDWNKRVGLGVVDAFSSKADHLGAQVKAIVSRRGFSKNALQRARKLFIGCCSLLPDDPGEVGFSIGDWWYTVIRAWDKLRLRIHFAGEPPDFESFNVASVKWQGKHVAKWFARELITKHGDETSEGDFTLWCEFDEPRQIEIMGKDYLVKQIDCIATRICRKKRTWVCWSGDAYIDWHSGGLRVPPEAAIVSSTIESDVSTWDDYEGKTPEPAKSGAPPTGVSIELSARTVQTWDHSQDDDVPDLGSL